MREEEAVDEAIDEINNEDAENGVTGYIEPDVDASATEEEPNE